MILKVNRPIPEYALKQIEEKKYRKARYSGWLVRRCKVSIAEEDAMTYIHPESFDFSDVYGTCELVQLKGQNPVISKFEFEKNFRSFEREALTQQKEREDAIRTIEAENRAIRSEVPGEERDDGTPGPCGDRCGCFGTGTES